MKETQRRVAKHASIDFNLNFTRSTVHPSSEPSAFRAVRKSRDLESFLGHLLGADCEWKKFPIEISKLRSLPTTMTGPEPFQLQVKRNSPDFDLENESGKGKQKTNKGTKSIYKLFRPRKREKLEITY